MACFILPLLSEFIIGLFNYLARHTCAIQQSSAGRVSGSGERPGRGCRVPDNEPVLSAIIGFVSFGYIIMNVGRRVWETPDVAGGR